MQATDFEFANRWWLFGVLFGAPFFTFAFDHAPFGLRIARLIAPRAHWSIDTTLHVVFGVAAGVLVVAALLRTWGSSYLGRDVVHDHDLRSESLRADGPFRHVRNPLYFGNILMAFAVGTIAPIAGCAIIIAAVTVYCYRLIGREEHELRATQGERYIAYFNAVPRLLPSLRPRTACTGATPDLRNGLAAEAYFWSFAFGLSAFAITLNILWFYGGLVASPLVSWLAGLALARSQRAFGKSA